MTHRFSVRGLLASLCGLGAAVTSSNAFALDHYVDLEPPETLTGYGYGYNSIARQHSLKQCVTFGSGRLDGGGPSGDSLQFNAVQSNDELADDMDIAVGSKFAMSMGIASVNTSTKVKFLQGTTTSFFRHTILASYSGVEPMKYIEGDIALKPEYLAMVNTPAFRAACGDYVVVGVQSGRWLYGTVQLVVKDTTTQSRLALEGAVDVGSGTLSTSNGLNTLETLKKSSKAQDLSIRLTTSSSTQNPVDIDQFIGVVKAFPGQNGAKQVYRLKAIPYEHIVSNWPKASNPLAGKTELDKLNTLAEAAFTLIALADDANFVVQNSALFALGTTPQKRAARETFIKARRNFYLSQLEAIRAGAKNCDVDWNGTPSCEQLHGKWKDWEDFGIAEYEQMPFRYTSDCSTPREVTLDGSGVGTALSTELMAKKGAFRNVKGDREISGGPTAFRAYLDFKPNFTGGDALSTRKLQAILDMQMQEKGGDQSTFEHVLKVDVADLAKPDLSGGAAPVTLNQCAYRGAGVRSPLVTPSASACEPLRALGFTQLADQCKAIVAGAAHHGMLFAVARKDARTETFTKGNSGVIQSIRCTVDSEQKDDTLAIGCDELKVGTVQFDLVNKEDVAADKWVSPPMTVNPALVKSMPKGIQPSPSYAAQVRKSLQTSKKPLSVSSKAVRVPSCVRGLVPVRGECVPALKR